MRFLIITNRFSTIWYTHTERLLLNKCGVKISITKFRKIQKYYFYYIVAILLKIIIDKGSIQTK